MRERLGFLDKLKPSVSPNSVEDRLRKSFSGLLGTLLVDKINKLVYSNLKKPKLTPDDKKIINDLKEQAIASGDVKSFYTFPEYVRKNLRKNIPPAAAKKVLQRVNKLVEKYKDTLAQEAFFHPKTKEIVVGLTDEPDIGILAHEIGHSKSRVLDNALGRLAFMFSKAWPSLYAAFGDPKTSTPKKLLISLLGASPMLGLEMLASYRGSKMLNELDYKGSKFKPWVGVPSYLLYSASPIASKYIAQLVSKFKR